ncbi:zinc finger protein VAR3, chloroplastic [Trifolium pratense]|uniref:zinc finger protein VAR3, chloroplastic n=1 Tax=Trifolium pratense TaxID=57577 RepID=UPI001E690B47|nr:zinc finger protein VAR3, chloroplastic [Trifolium pratense]
MSSLKLTLYGTSLFRHTRTQTVTTKLNHPFLFFKPLHRHGTSFSTTAAAATTSTAAETASSVDHPWPEWISFVDRLTAKGYLSKSDDSVYSNSNLLKDASLSFARDRYDIFKLLSSKDIQAVVKGGCPNLLRKAVNSAKRLRAHLRLEEGDVCSACNVRDSCDRAYMILQESEADVRTVDIVRILLSYAIDPLVLSGGEKPPGRDVIESSARKLLSQLIELSELSPPPAPVPAHSKSTAHDSGAKDKHDSGAKGKPLNFRALMLSKTLEMKKGDWVCSKCNFMNFARNMQCLQCEEDRPKNIDSPNIELRAGDWTCSECKFLNFARNTKCRTCQTEGPQRVNRLNTNEVQMKKGDWTCPQCGFMNFSSKVKCLKCPEPRPMKHPGDWSCPKCDFMNFANKDACFRCQESNPNPNKYPRDSSNPNSKKYPGDWSCPKCDFFNYARNTTCLKCNTKPHGEQPTNEDDEHTWRRPY